MKKKKDKEDKTMAIKNRYDFVMIFDVENGNPNGDPDAGNMPRIDSETNYGIITDVCLKRKIRNYVELIKEDEPGFNILIKPDRTLNSKFKEAYEKEGIQPDKKKPEIEMQAQRYMCKNYYDVRVFGAVMSTGTGEEKYKCGVVRGPVQINFAKSVSPIFPNEIAITRQAKTNDERQEKEGTSEMGRKNIVPYGLYRAEGYVSAALANKVTDLDDKDIELLWEAIINMFEHDHSAARGKMCMRKLIVFEHDNVLGNCPSHLLFDRIKIKQKIDEPPRAFEDYEITIDKDNMPAGVTLIEKI